MANEGSKQESFEFAQVAEKFEATAEPPTPAPADVSGANGNEDISGNKKVVQTSMMFPRSATVSGGRSAC